MLIYLTLTQRTKLIALALLNPSINEKREKYLSPIKKNAFRYGF